MVSQSPEQVYASPQEPAAIEAGEAQNPTGQSKEDDVFDEDFQETDEEEDQDDTLAGEKILQKEENEARKVRGATCIIIRHA